MKKNSDGAKLDKTGFFVANEETPNVPGLAGVLNNKIFYHKLDGLAAQKQLDALIEELSAEIDNLDGMEKEDATTVEDSIEISKQKTNTLKSIGYVIDMKEKIASRHDVLTSVPLILAACLPLVVEDISTVLIEMRFNENQTETFLTKLAIRQSAIENRVIDKISEK